MRKALSVRRRLVVVFLLSVALSTSLLSLGTYLLVRQDRQASSIGRATDEVRVQMQAARRRARKDGIERAIQRLTEHYQRRNGVDVLFADSDSGMSSGSSGQLAALLESHIAATEGPRTERVIVKAIPYVIVRDELEGMKVSFIFSEENVARQLSRLRSALVMTSLALVAIAGIVGRKVARHTLRPVARTSEMAAEIAAGNLEARLAETRADEFGELANAFNRMASALQDKMSALQAAREKERNFAADFSHELRTPLAAVANDAALLLEYVDDAAPEPQRLAELLESDTNRLIELSEEVIDLREATEPVSARLEEVTLHAFVSDLAAPHMGHHEVHIDIPSGLTVRTDVIRLKRVLGNLLANAIQHGGKGIAVSARDLHGEVRITVSDSGPGIPEEALPRLFDRFYRVDPARGGGGKGLGLAIAAECAEAAGLRLSVASEPGAGASFCVHVSLPDSSEQGRVSF